MSLLGMCSFAFAEAGARTPHPQQNSTAARFHYTAMDTVKALLHDSKLGASFWTEALLTVVYIVFVIMKEQNPRSRSVEG